MLIAGEEGGEGRSVAGGGEEGRRGGRREYEWIQKR